MARTVKLGDHLVPEILAHLSKFGAIPNEGVLGGQCVCSAILDLYGDGGGVYNDIDIFREASTEQATFFRSTEHKEDLAVELGIPLLVLDEYGTMGQFAESGMQMLGNTREGMVNYIWCATTGGKPLTAALAVSVFDINAVEVAIDLATNTMVWSRGFEHFLKTRQLELTSVNTPLRTLLRYLKKKAELKAYGDDELAVQLAHFWICHYTDDVEYDAPPRRDSEPEMVEDLSKTPVLSIKYVELAAKYLGSFTSYFALDDAGQVRLRDGNPSYARMEEVLSELQQYSEEDLEGFVRWFPMRSYADTLEQGAGEASRLRRYSRYHERVVEQFSLSWDDQMDWFKMSATFMGAPYLRSARSARHIREISRFVHAHHDVIPVLIGLTLQEQYEAVSWIKKRIKTDGMWLAGVVATEGLPVDLRLQIHREAFLRRMESKRPAEKLCEALFEPWTDGVWSISELTHRTELEHEGAVMRHCVGGYAGSVHSGTYRVLSLKHADKAMWSTLSLHQSYISSAKELRVQQHYGARNRPVHLEALAVMKAYLEREAARLALTVPQDRNKGQWHPLPMFEDVQF